MVGVSQADGEDRDMPLGGDRRRLEGIRLLVVTVGDQQDRLIAVGPGLKHFESLANRVADRRAAAWRAARIKLVKRPAEGVVIDRERTLHHRLTGKGDQAHAFPFQPVDEGRHVGLGTSQPAGRDVLGEHRPRDVDQHIEIAAAGNHLFILRSEAWPGQGHQACHECRLTQEQLHPEAGRRILRAESATTWPGPQRPRPPDAAAGENPARAPATRPHRQDQVQPLRMLPFHLEPLSLRQGTKPGFRQHTDQENHRQARPGKPGIQFRIFRVLRLLERGFFQLIDLGIDLRQSLGIGGVEILASPGLGHLPQQVFVDPKLSRHQHAIAVFVFLGNGHHATATDADRVQSNPRFGRDAGRFARVDDARIAITVGQQYQNLKLMKRL